MNPTKKLPEFVRVGAVVRATVGDLSVEGEVGRVDSPGNVYTPKGFYIAAVDDDRAEWTLGRPAPSPTEPGAKGQPRLSPRFCEWMMMLPEGWVTGVPGISRNDQLKALGNGVVPAQVEAAIRAFLQDSVL